MIKAQDRRPGSDGNQNLMQEYGLSYSPVGNQFGYLHTPLITFSAQEALAFNRFFLGLRALYIFSHLCHKPVSLVMDHHRGCQLRCKYCYSQVHKDQGHRVSPARLHELQQAFKFTSISYFGGDPFYDWEYTTECLDAMGEADDIYASTNGIGVTEPRVRQFQSYSTRFLFQLSIEPPEWGQRINVAGKHQSQLLNDQIRSLPPDIPIHLGLAIPRTGLIEWKSRKETLDYFKSVIGTRPMTVNWKLEESTDEQAPTYQQASLPVWYAEWLQDEIKELQGEYSITQCKQGLFGTHTYRLHQLAGLTEPPFSYTACQAGMGSLGIGPSGELFTCHHKAVINDPAYRIETVTPRGLWDTMRSIISHPNNAVCAGCCSQYVCGGVCFADLNNEACESARASFGPSCVALHKLYPAKYASLVNKTNKEAENYKKHSDKYHALVSTRDWDNLLSGSLTADEMQALYLESFGYPLELDIPLWALPAPKSTRTLCTSPLT